MASRNTPIDRSVADKTASFGKELAERANEAKDSLSDMARTATTKVVEGRSMAADRLDSVASAVQERVDELPGGQRVKEFASAAADRLSTTADYVRTHDAKRMTCPPTETTFTLCAYVESDLSSTRDCRIRLTISR